ncbi:hypothetical protein Tco_0580555 [Tanacetum coccineum]
MLLVLKIVHLNKDNYVPWSSRLLRYANNKLNGKLIYNSIMHGPYVRRMIPEPGDLDREVPVAKTFHEQTNEELTEKEVKQMEADDQAIQIILMGLPKDIYAAVDSCETAQEIWLRVQQMMKGSDIGIQDKKAKLCQWLEVIVGINLDSMLGRMLGIRIGISNQNLNPNRNGNVVAARVEGNAIGNNDAAFLQTQLLIAQKEGVGIQLQAEEFDFMAATGDLEGIEEVNANCVLMTNLQRASTSEEQYNELLDPIPKPHQVQQNDSNVISAVSSMEQGGGTVE